MRVLLLVAMCAHAQTVTREAELGRAVFRIYCAPCHGRNAEGGRGPDLTRGTFNAGERDADLIRVISEGVRGTDMIGFADMISRENMERVVAYVREMAQPNVTIAGNPAEGERLFWGNAGCGGCHQVGSRGQSFGPELTRIGRSRNADYLRKALVQPDTHIAPGYRGVVVETRDGHTLTGIELGLDQFSVRIVGQDGRYHSFLRDEVKRASVAERSLMPSYAKKFTNSELSNVIIYLLSLKGEPSK